MRLIGVGGTNLEQGGRQLRLFEQEDRRQAQLDVGARPIRAKYGESSIRRASLMDEPDEPWVSREPPRKT